jgi:threonine aldolase
MGRVSSPHASSVTRRQWLQALAVGAGTVETIAACPACAASPAPVASVSATAAAPPQADADKEREALMGRCKASLTIATRAIDGRELVRIGEWCQKNGATADEYGEGEFIEGFERRIAALLGFEAACFMPTGTMGQLALLRIYADRAGVRAVGVHPSSHHVLHEEGAAETLHGVRPVVMSPWSRPLLAEDVKRTGERLAAVSVELPVRWTGRLQTWDELEKLKAACHDAGVALHMDGARLWDCQPYYGRSYAEICRGFASVYVSFYKTIGGLAGAMIAGTKATVAEARTWRHRQGGNVFTLFPFVASAAMRLDPVLARIPAWNARARTLAARIAADPRAIVAPAPTPTALFHVYLRGEPADLERRRDAIARERGIWVTHGFGKARVPGFADAELHVAEGIDAISDDEAARAVLALLA